MLLKNTANSQMVLRINGADRILKPNEAIEGSEDLLSQNLELREVRKVKTEVDKNVDVKHWESLHGPLPEGKVLKHVVGTSTMDQYELVDEAVYEIVDRTVPVKSPNTILVEDVEDLPFADGRVSKSEKTLTRERKSGKEESEKVEKAHKL